MASGNTTTTTTRPCVYKSITLAAGEQFTTPPGAVVISSSAGLDGFTSTCPKPDCLETPVCYTSEVVDTDVLGGHTPAYVVVTLLGVYVGNTYYPFANQFNFENTTSSSAFQSDLQTALNSTPIGALFLNLGITGNWQTNGEYFQFRFNIIPSIGDQLSFYAYADGGHTGGPGFPIKFVVRKC